MSEAKPTPGPWYFRTEGQIPGLAEVQAIPPETPSERYRVATCHENDARLIAAAPDLLNACRMVAEMAVGWQPLTPGDIAEVKRAIARAEGR